MHFAFCLKGSNEREREHIISCLCTLFCFCFNWKKRKKARYIIVYLSKPVCFATRLQGCNSTGFRTWLPTPRAIQPATEALRIPTACTKPSPTVLIPSARKLLRWRGRRGKSWCCGNNLWWPWSMLCWSCVSWWENLVWGLKACFWLFYSSIRCEELYCPCPWTENARGIWPHRFGCMQWLWVM